MKRAGRSVYHKLFWLPLTAIIMLTLIASASHGARPGSPPGAFFVMCIFALLGWLVLGRRIAYWLVPLFVTTIKCPGCSEEMSTVGVWNCECGFKDHRETNILSKSCPKCGKGAGHLDCPRCDCTILLW
jgi:hypothetical protein